jgi:hypothetical protein
MRAQNRLLSSWDGGLYQAVPHSVLVEPQLGLRNKGRVNPSYAKLVTGGIRIETYRRRR